jgi:cytochrome c peroxidase
MSSGSRSSAAMTGRRHPLVRSLSIAALAVAAALGATIWTGSPARAQAPATYDWKLPAKFPVPFVPADNPMSDAKVELGRHLFYDTRMSANGTQSCATCHEQARAFTDGKARSVGSMDETHPRGSMSLVNVAYAAVLTWGNPTITRLEDQALVPMYGEHPIELGLASTDIWIEAFTREPTYRRLFEAAFGDSGDPFTRVNAVKAIASFERSIVSARSPYDRYHFDRDDSAVPAAAERGEILFYSRPLSCFMCHGGASFSSAMPGNQRATMEVEFHNTGLYNLPGPLSYPAPNTGIYEMTGKAADVGKFKPPTLRNIAVTAPYMHDGSVATLDEAIDHYAAGGRTIADGPNRGVGHDNPNKSDTIRGFTLTAEQRADLIAFLQSLTDQELLRDPRFSNPWPTRTSRARQP